MRMFKKKKSSMHRGLMRDSVYIQELSSFILQFISKDHIREKIVIESMVDKKKAR